MQTARARHTDGFVNAENFVVAHLGMKRSWWKTFDSLDTPDNVADVPQCAAFAMRDSATGPSPAPVAVHAVAHPKHKAKTKSKARTAASEAHKKASAEIAEDRKRAKNTLDCVLKWKCDQTFVSRVRQLVLASEPEVKEHGHYTSNVFSETQTETYFSELAAGSWMQPLRDTLETCYDAVRLRRAGFITDPSVAEGCTLQSDLVSLEDALSEQYLALVFGIVRHRASRCKWLDLACASL